jgi:hypothetical protein
MSIDQLPTNIKNDHNSRPLSLQFDRSILVLVLVTHRLLNVSGSADPRPPICWLDAPVTNNLQEMKLMKTL